MGNFGGNKYSKFCDKTGRSAGKMLAYSAGNQGSILGKSGKIVQNMSVEHLQSELDKPLEGFA